MMNAILTYNVKPEDHGKTTETVLRHKMNISSKLLTKLKLSKKIFINNIPCRSIDTLSKGDTLTADVTENEHNPNILPYETDLEVLYDDEFLTVVNKPSNMSVHPSIGNHTSTLANAIEYFWSQNHECHKFHAVNRLDKNTSGICVIAKNRFAHGVLAQQTRLNLFSKKYIAIVHSTPSPSSGTINLPITRIENSVIKRGVSPQGKEAITHYKVLAENNGLSMIEVVLDTGRTHQIRVHFSAIGHPLVGDWLYGKSDEDLGANRHLLHVCQAEFNHPATGKKLVFDLPIPKDMSNLFDIS